MAAAIWHNNKTGRPVTREEIQHAYAAKQERYAVIRRDFDAGMSERAIESTHHVGRRTIIINAMIGADPQIATATIWQRLADEHVTEHTDELIAEFEQEQNDHGLRCWQHNCTAPTKHSAAGRSPAWRTPAPNRHAKPSYRDRVNLRDCVRGLSWSAGRS
jgi:hypothetical protein